MFKYLFTTIVIFMSLMLTSCDESVNDIEFVDYTIKIDLPEDERLEGVSPERLTVTLININTNSKVSKKTDENGYAYFTDIVGVFKIEVSGDKVYTYVNESNQAVKDTLSLVGVKQNILLTKANTTETVETEILIKSKGWVIKEMYTASTRTQNGGALRFDQFIEIYNNTDHILYADGMSIGETRHQTTSGENIFTVDMSKQRKTYLWALYTLPGKSGDKNIPVQPGKSLVIAPQPIDHREYNSLDLRPPVSDYQWFDGHASFSIDVPEVPNLINYYSATQSVWVVTVQMNRGFVILNIPEGMDMTTFVKDNMDVRLNNAGNPVTSIGVPNNYILDAVDLGYRDRFYLKSLHPSLDFGFSYTLATYNGKSIRRKISHIEDDGRVVYMDTNNSTNDFWTSRTPSPKQYPTDDEVSHE